jgi:rhamnose transport system ATP-binding protein
VTPPLLQLNNVTRTFGAVRALRGVTFNLRANEVHALIGENGAGKSTLIKLITGAHRPDSGSIEIDGSPAPALNPGLARAKGIAAIYQQPALFADLSVAENIALGLEKPAVAKRVCWQERRDRARHLLKRIGSDLDPEIEVKELSMPEQQMVEIARALGAGARILIMDEPTASLTGKEVRLLLQLVRDLRSQGTGIIYISHRLEEVFQVADRVTVLRDGESVGSRNIAGEQVNESELIRLMVGRELSAEYPPRHKTSQGEPVLSVQNLGCSRSGIHAINFEIRAGEILGVAGLVGAGRTELARTLFGITPADSGSITLLGKRLLLRSPQDAVQAGIGYVPEDRRRHGVILSMPVSANVTMSIHRRIFPGGWLRLETERTLTRDYVRDLAIKAPSTDTEVWRLSGGNQQKVALARWLATSPKVLILDEPTQGVDVGAKAEIHKLTRQLANRGLAVLFISSELPEVLGMSDRIAVMRGGTIATIFDGGTTDPHTVMVAAFGSGGLQ